MTPATLDATLSCRSKTSSSEPSKRSGPEMRPGFSLDQLRADADAVAASPHRALEDIAHAEFAPDLLHVDRLALVGEGRIAREHEQPANAAERGDDLLDHA